MKQNQVDPRCSYCGKIVDWIQTDRGIWFSIEPRTKTAHLCPQMIKQMQINQKRDSEKENYHD